MLSNADGGTIGARQNVGDIAITIKTPWWRHQMETFSTLLVIFAGYSLATGESPAQRPVMRSFDVFFDLRLNYALVTYIAVAVRFCGLRFVKRDFLKIVRSCGTLIVGTNVTATPRRSFNSWNQNRKVTTRRPGGDRTATSRLLQLLQACRTAAVRAPQGRRKDAVRPPYDFLVPRDRVKTVCHLTGIARRPYGHRTVILRCGCGVAALRFLKIFLCQVKKKPRKGCDDLAAC